MEEVKKIRHNWIQNGSVKYNKKCVTCGVQQSRTLPSNKQIFYVNGGWIQENPNCVDNSEFYK